ncbi:MULTISPECIES: SGNH/GDSL hydrolase family protein [Synechocystis]|uniref:G-D-S-L family lipolytic protein n=1 Tax=Synechocystis salina LEGE 00031 TaxID=1828736 RepID=A0ABR9VSD0_9SYNC|nr:MULTISPECIES: SGNH/GDSL hydrolase family protein [Synechocystis]MBD2652878.1 G-D-S-L family lipolytic protein [Synechocystis sp. FACHB-383]MBE9196937.1 G-D-S-L family lipolytic protein [Synechocystis sp. LEGE 06083]MBE9240812.1 G-D-S-L family lipolytic protein [Synechocystis salina LEGE 00041]MBE9254272.1 G-D-S-L family lipolytic protein [Synechocystis salina LEGE 00031]
MQTISPASTLTQTPRFDHPLKVLAMGDSLVYGYGDPIGGGWAERLRRFWMEENGPVLYNLGIRGDRVAQVSERLEQEFRLRGEIRNKVPDLLILSVGVNDSPRLGRPDGRCFTDEILFQKQVEQLLDSAHQLCPVLFIGMVPVNEARMPFLDCFYFNHSDQRRFKTITQQACGDRQIPYLDIFEIWQQRGQEWINDHLMADGLHPNVAGYKALLDDIHHWQPLKELTSKVSQP